LVIKNLKRLLKRIKERQKVKQVVEVSNLHLKKPEKDIQEKWKHIKQ
jgi:hypothetical protein